jgi:hypothetical protein
MELILIRKIGKFSHEKCKSVFWTNVTSPLVIRRIISPSVYHGKIIFSREIRLSNVTLLLIHNCVCKRKKWKNSLEFIAIQIMLAQAQRLYPKIDPFDPNYQHIAFLNSHVKSFSKQFKNTNMRHFKFHWEFIYGKIFSNEYFPVISRIRPQVVLETRFHSRFWYFSHLTSG